jgi:multidrug resistance efflux pump
MRFRKELEDAQAAAAASSADNSNLRARLELAESQVAAVEAFTRKRCVHELTCCRIVLG